MRNLNSVTPRDRPSGPRDARGTVRIHDFGDEVHLWFEQRVPWPVALEILRELKAPGPTHNATSRLRRSHRRRRASKASPARRSTERQAA
jgi:hypothetical protein